MVFFLFSLTSCEKDLYENNIKNENRAIIKKISFDDFKKNSPAFEKYQDLTTKKKQMNQGKIIYDSINNFYIDTDKIIFAQKDGISWFTFPVSRDYTFGKTENLILRSTISGKFVPLLLEYDFTFQDKQKVENNLEIPNLTEKTKVKFLEKLKIEDFESESENKEAEYYCVDIIYSWCSGDQKHPGGFESNGSKCPCHEESKIKVCNSTNNGSATPYNPGLPFGQSPPNYGSNTHGNGTNNSQIDINTTGGVYGNGGTNGLGIVTIPVLSVQTTTQIKLAFQAFLNNSAQIAWLNNPLNTNLRYTIIKYLTDNQVVIDVEQTNPTFIFAQEMIVQIMLNPTLYTSITPFLIEKKIDDNLLDPCSKSVFQQIKNTTNCDFANVLAKLNANDKIYKTKIITDYNYDNNGNQITDPGNTKRTIIGVKYDYTIYVNPNYSGKTKLYIASLLLHELTHAYFFSLLDDLNLGASNSFYELPILYNVFKNHTSNFNPALTHEEIANTYTSAISSALKEYAISTGTPSDFPNLDQICSDLAWAGLMDTDIYNSVHPEGSASWQRIKNRISSEQSGHPVTEGGITQNNIGQPCN